jgi:hypothetical protein
MCNHAWKATPEVPMSSYALAVAFLAIGGVLVFLGLPKGLEMRPWTRSGPMQMLYPVLCLLFLVMGVAFLFSGQP